jgi:hypothetical protein
VGTTPGVVGKRSEDRHFELPIMRLSADRSLCTCIHSGFDLVLHVPVADGVLPRIVPTGALLEQGRR